MPLGTAQALDANLEALARARNESAKGVDDARRFYHLLLMECAEHLSVAQFAKCIKVAQEQIAKPL